MPDIELWGWTPEPSARGTANIIWSCVVTVFLTTWTVHHPMVGKTGFSDRLVRFLRSITLPEYQLFNAVDLFIVARKLRKNITMRPSWQDWTLSQAFHVVIGGWELEETTYQRRRPRKLMAWMAFAAGIFQSTYTYDDFAGPEITAHKKCSKVSPCTFVDLVNMSKIERSRAPSPDNIRSRTEIDRLAKAITVFQVLWFLADIAWRLATTRHVSLLEVLTLGYVACGLGVYVALFSCPQVVKVPSTVAASGNLGASDMPATTPSAFQLGDLSSYGLWAVMGGLSAAVYLAAWAYPFNSDTARWTWHCSALAMTPLTFVQRLIEQRSTRIDNQRLPWTTMVAWEFLSFSLLVPRLALIGVAIWSLKLMPSDVYDKPVWGSYIGHFGS